MKNKRKKEKFTAEETVIPISSITNEKTLEIISAFDSICLPFSEGTGLKEQRILSFLNDNGVNAIYREGVGIIVPSIVETTKVVSSHIDLISKFQKGFSKEEPERFLLLERDKIPAIVGALDNNITNAILMLIIVELRRAGFAQDVECVFTEGEETDMHGMKNYVDEKGNLPFYINLDVTPDNYKKDASIEYDNPSWTICKQIKDNIPCDVGFQKERVDDDLDMVVKANAHGFSFCLPTKETIHSYKNYTAISKLKKYYKGLKYLLKSLDVSDVEPDISYMEIKKAIKLEKEDFLIEEKKLKDIEKERRKSYSSNSHVYAGTGRKIISYQDTWNIEDEEEEKHFYITAKDKVSYSLSVSFILNRIKEINPDFVVSEEAVSFLYTCYIKDILDVKEFYSIFNVDITKDSNLSLILKKDSSDEYTLNISSNFYADTERLNLIKDILFKYGIDIITPGQQTYLTKYIEEHACSGFSFTQVDLNNAINFAYSKNTFKLDSLFEELFLGSYILNAGDGNFYFNVNHSTFDEKLKFEKTIDYKKIYKDKYLSHDDKQTISALINTLKEIVPNSLSSFVETTNFLTNSLKNEELFEETELVYHLNKDIKKSGGDYTAYLFLEEFLKTGTKIGLFSKMNKKYCIAGTTPEEAYVETQEKKYRYLIDPDPLVASFVKFSSVFASYVNQFDSIDENIVFDYISNSIDNKIITKGELKELTGLNDKEATIAVENFLKDPFSSLFFETNLSKIESKNDSFQLYFLEIEDLDIESIESYNVDIDSVLIRSMKYVDYFFYLIEKENMNISKKERDLIKSIFKKRKETEHFSFTEIIKLNKFNKIIRKFINEYELIEVSKGVYV